MTAGQSPAVIASEAKQSSAREARKQNALHWLLARRFFIWRASRAAGLLRHRRAKRRRSSNGYGSQ
jgi:hypothetical protein